MEEELMDAIVNMEEEDALLVTRNMLDGGTDPMRIMEVCRQAMEVVGQRFEEGEYFVPELIMSGEVLRQIADVVRPEMGEASQEKRLGKVVIGTVAGDIHDLGKNIVTFMLDINGFEVHDLGVDIPPEKFVEKIKEVGPEVVGLSALMTLAFDSMKETVEAIESAGLREKVRIMIGGGAVDEKVKEYARADAYGKDAVKAVALAKAWTGGE